MNANLVPLSEDPDDPDYRYPVAGERLWHRRGCWVVVTEDQDPGDAIIPAVRVVVDSEGADDGGGSPLAVGAVAVVKLKSLYEPERDPLPEPGALIEFEIPGEVSARLIVGDEVDGVVSLIADPEDE